MRRLLIAFMVFALCGAASAAPVSLTNPSFEAQTVVDGTTLNSYWTSWNCIVAQPLNPIPPSTQGFGLRNPNGTELATPQTATDGVNFGILGRVSTLQTTWDRAWQSTVQIQANTIYTLTFDLAAITSQPSDEFIAGSLISSSSSSTLGTTTLGFVYDDARTDYQWLTGNTVVWDSTGSSEVGNYLEILFDGNRVCVDNVRLDATLVPEPATLSLLGLGSLLLVFRRRA